MRHNKLKSQHLPHRQYPHGAGTRTRASFMLVHLQPAVIRFVCLPLPSVSSSAAKTVENTFLALQSKPVNRWHARLQLVFETILHLHATAPNACVGATIV